MPFTPHQDQLRSAMKQRRGALSDQLQREAASSALQHLQSLAEYRTATHIAMYCATGGELDTWPAAREAMDRNACVYLPVMLPGYRMEFARHTSPADLVQNRFGLLEPPGHATRLAADRLDVVLTPLVACDSRGYRLGMGGGYYDRCFSFRLHGTLRPVLVGMGHEFQLVDHVPEQAWDVPLDILVTPAGIRRFPPGSGVADDSSLQG